MSAYAWPPEILVDAGDNPTELDEAEPPAAGNRVPEGGMPRLRMVVQRRWSCGSLARPQAAFQQA